MAANSAKYFNQAAKLLLIIFTAWGLWHISFVCFMTYPIKKHQAEAKRQLAAILNSELDFEQKNGRFALDPSMWKLEDFDECLYVFGYSPHCVEKFNGSGKFLFTPKCLNNEVRSHLPEIEKMFAAIPDSECRDPKDGFRAYAFGVIAPSGIIVGWRIDETRQLKNSPIGL